MKARWSSLTRSLKFRVLVVVVAELMLASLLLFLTGFWSMELLQQKIYESDETELRISVQQYDSDLEKMRGFLTSEFRSAIDRGTFSRDNPRLEYNRTDAYSRYMDQNGLFNHIEGFGFCTLFDKQAAYTFTSHGGDFQSRDAVLSYIKSDSDALRKTGRWSLLELEGRPMLLSVVGNDEMVFFGWTSCATLLGDFSEIDSGARFYITSEDGRILANGAAASLPVGETLDLSKRDRGDDLTSSVASSESGVRLTKVTDKRVILRDFSFLRTASLLFFLSVPLFGVPLLFFLLDLSVFRPVRRLEQGMKDAGKQEMERPVELPRGSSNEMKHLANSFNRMTEEIHDLKIQSYEEELEKQKLQLNAMQLQIEPHFYLNALNLVDTMAQMGDTGLIHSLIENLSAYLRYIVSTSDGRTTVGEELDHVAHYMNIMQLRFGENFRFQLDVDPSLKSTVIPPLLIQMLVENSMKYAFDVYGSTVLRVSVRWEEASVVITEEDNGPGYPEKILTQFRENRAPEDNKHIGLWNVKQRLYYMYPDQARMVLENTQEGGARTKIVLPGKEEDN